MLQSNEVQRDKQLPQSHIIISKEVRSQSKHNGLQIWIWCLSFCFVLGVGGGGWARLCCSLDWPHTQCIQSRQALDSWSSYLYGPHDGTTDTTTTLSLQAFLGTSHSLLCGCHSVFMGTNCFQEPPMETRICGCFSIFCISLPHYYHIIEAYKCTTYAGLFGRQWGEKRIHTFSIKMLLFLKVAPIYRYGG